VIERIFGVVKRKYQILRSPSEYSIATQNRIILVCCILHNFVRSLEGQSADNWLDIETEGNREKENIQPAVAYPEGSSISSKKMDKFRDSIAEKMWAQYQGYITERDAI
jgi:hypothetical protein